MCNDDPEVYERRMGRVLSRHFERAKTRDPRIEQDLFETLRQDDKENSFAQLLLDETKFNPVLSQKTQPIRDYIVSESLQQYKDYYESDREEQPFLEYFDNLTNRDKIRFSEIYEDYTMKNVDDKEYIMIPKREHNPELSLFSNFLLDLQDFKDRVVPLAHDITLDEAAQRYQRHSAKDILEQADNISAMANRIKEDIANGKTTFTLQDYEDQVHKEKGKLLQ